MAITVRSGDNLSKLARQMGVSLGALMKANPGINPHLIRPGQKLNSPRSRSLSAKDNAKQMSRMVGTAGFRTSEEIRGGKTLTDAFADRGISAPETFAGFQANAAGLAAQGAAAVTAQGVTGPTIDPAAGTGLVSTRFQDDTPSLAATGLGEEKTFLQSLRGLPSTTAKVPLGLMSASEKAALGRQTEPVQPATDVVGRRPGDPGYIRTGVGSAVSDRAPGKIERGITTGVNYLLQNLERNLGGKPGTLTGNLFAVPEAAGGQAEGGPEVRSAFSPAGVADRVASVMRYNPEMTEAEAIERVNASSAGQVYSPGSTDHGRLIVDVVMDPLSDGFSSDEANRWGDRVQSQLRLGQPLEQDDLITLGWNTARVLQEADLAGKTGEEIRDLAPEISQIELLAITAQRMGYNDVMDYIADMRYAPLDDEGKMWKKMDRTAGLTPFVFEDFQPSFGGGGGGGGGGGRGFGSGSGTLTHDWRIRIT